MKFVLGLALFVSVAALCSANQTYSTIITGDWIHKGNLLKTERYYPHFDKTPARFHEVTLNYETPNGETIKYIEILLSDEYPETRYTLTPALDTKPKKIKIHFDFKKLTGDNHVDAIVLVFGE